MYTSHAKALLEYFSLILANLLFILIYESVGHFPCRDMLLLIVSLSDRLTEPLYSHPHTLTRPQSFVPFK
jgi:hypothetical protein